MNTLDYNVINRKLTDLYKEHLCKYTKTELENAFGTNDYSNPLLIHCWEDYTKDYVRIMYIGRETNSWYSNYNCIDKYGYYEISQLIDLVVKEFDFQYSSPFFNLLYKINEKLNKVCNIIGAKPDIHNFLWTNVFKFGRYEKGKGRPRAKVRHWENANFNILRSEIEITSPNIIIFVTGKDDNFYIKPILGDIQIFPLDFQKNIVEIKPINTNIKAHIYRIPRPERRKREYIDSIVNILVSHYKESNITLNA